VPDFNQILSELIDRFCKITWAEIGKENKLIIVLDMKTRGLWMALMALMCCLTANAPSISHYPETLGVHCLKLTKINKYRAQDE